MSLALWVIATSMLYLCYMITKAVQNQVKTATATINGINARDRNEKAAIKRLDEIVTEIGDLKLIIRDS